MQERHQKRRTTPFFLVSGVDCPGLLGRRTLMRVAKCLSLFFVGLLFCGTAAAQKVGATDIGGVVSGPKGPEAGVWVIAETTDLPTKYAKVVVTDGKGRYLIPDLPKANYDVWVRGYGLVDSPKVKAVPGKSVNLKAVTAKTENEAAHYYPGMYWYSMLN